MNETHDPALASYVPSAMLPDADFTLQNLPFGVFRRGSEPLRGGIAIGDQIVDLARLHGGRVLSGRAAEACAAALAPSLNAYLALGSDSWSALRLSLSRLLRAGAAERSVVEACLVRQSDAELTLPVSVGDYTDFYTSIHHARRVGALFRPDQPLMPNYKWLPIAYHGRSSSIVVSGTPVIRPRGQTMAPGADAPVVKASARLDYELELGVVIGPASAHGARVALDDADRHVYGLCLLNDWSARDVQGWEYQPLGPFAGKNFATTLSPWLVSLEALEPYRLPWSRAVEDPAPLAYLESAHNRARGAFDIRLETRLETASMRRAGVGGALLATSNYRDAYWTLAQMVAHHSLNGCPLRPGDVLGTGTLSGPSLAEAGCLLELSAGGKEAVTLQGGETRTFLADGDAVELHAFCAREGAARVGFGVARGVVLPAEHEA